jgi:hypothetical protein
LPSTTQDYSGNDHGKDNKAAHAQGAAARMSDDDDERNPPAAEGKREINYCTRQAALFHAHAHLLLKLLLC